MAAPTDAPAATTKWKPTPDEQADLDAMNTAIIRMQKHTPKDPYVLEIPQDVEPRYHHYHAASRRQWLDNTPFGELEHEITQYQTFHYHEHGKEMYVLHNSRREDNVSSSVRSAAVKTSSAAPKKKMTLDAYKKKQNGASSTPELKATKASDATGKQAAVKGPVERVKAETEDILAAVEEDVPLVKKAEDNSTLSDLKRKREDSGVVKAAGDAKGAHAEEAKVEPSAKKAKLSSDVKSESKSEQKGSKVAHASRKDSPDALEENGLPRMLSPEYPPALPPRLSPGIEDDARATVSHEDSLPKRLTSDLPDNISKLLRTREQIASAYATKRTSKEKEVRQSSPKIDASTITKQAPRNGFRAGSRSPTMQAGQSDRGRPTSSMEKREHAELSQDEEVAVGKSLKGRSATQLSAQHRASRVIKLKYKKAKAGDIARILKMRPVPDKSMLPSPPPTEPVDESEAPAKLSGKKVEERKEAATTKGVAQRIGPAAKREKKAAALQAERQAALDKPTPAVKSVTMEKQASVDKRSDHGKQGTGEKRPSADDGKRASPTKKIKVEGTEGRKAVTTPIPREPDSPAGYKSHLQATPTARHNLLAAHMARDKSQDSNSTQTPSGLSSTPNLTSQSTGHARPPSSQPTSKTPRQQAWEAEQKRLDTLGRELKHASTAHLQATVSSAPLAEQKLAAVKAVESLLCYLLAFACADEAAFASESGKVPSVGLWRSLSGFYGFVRRTNENFTQLSGLVSSLGVVFSSHILDIATRYPAKDHISREDLLETAALLQRAASDADAKLDVEILQEHFPRSWSQRTRKPLPAREKYDLTKLEGPFKLPFGPATSPIRAARAGHAILKEWVEKERVGYELKLKLKSD
jgi:hypothetical protein